MATTIPAGTIIAFGGSVGTVPNGWLLCDGTAYSATLYPALFQAIGNGWGGNQATFNVPDLQGYFLRGVDPNATVDPDASSRGFSMSNNPLGNGNNGDTVGSSEDDQVGSHTNTFSTAIGADQAASQYLVGYGIQNLYVGYLSDKSAQTSPGYWPAGYSGSETRPKNKYVYYLICTGD